MISADPERRWAIRASAVNGIKTAEQQKKYGGVAGLALDPATTRPAIASNPCGTVADKDVYRQLNKRCSLYGNINRTAMDVNSDAVAAAVMTFALDTPRWRRSGRPQRRPKGGRRAGSGR